MVVLRMGHRPGRDERTSTHVALVSRALGADRIVYDGWNAERVKESLDRVNEKWGGSFSVEGGESWRKFIKDWKNDGGTVVHLTMYGLSINDEIQGIRKSDDVLVVVGAEKVPREVYDLADFNVAVSNQPHSEIAALAVFLDRFYKGDELDRTFNGAERRIEPSGSGKNVKELVDYR
ncbi:MAG: tRNA (cytidine(56)-2'-O)-methyltransferase [Candidatus Hadarchaeia archaeon]